MFPSPYGDIFLKLYHVGCGVAVTVTTGFPSPYGDIFLKYPDVKYGDWKRCAVSVPLRGYFFEISSKEVYQAYKNLSFRPLTGIFF